MAGPLLETELKVPRRRRDLVAVQAERTPEPWGRVIADPRFRAGRLRQDHAAGGLAGSPCQPMSGPRRGFRLTARQRARARSGPTWSPRCRRRRPGLAQVRSRSCSRPSRRSKRSLATLLNDLGAIPNDVVLVLDDYHVIDAREVHDGMAFLLEHLPPQLHLVIASRADPALPLARLRGAWRARRDPRRRPALHARRGRGVPQRGDGPGTDGTGRRSAGGAHRRVDRRAAARGALDAGARRRRRASSPASPGMTGTSSTTWSRRSCSASPNTSGSFLLQTSILDRLSGPLCDAVTGQDGGRACSRRSNEATCSWSRSMTAASGIAITSSSPTFCRRTCWTSSPTAVPELHRRASVWYEQNGEPAEAIRHALAAEDFERAADLIELAIPELRRDRQEATLRRWLKVIPDELLRVRPVLNIGFVGALVSGGQLEGIKERLRDAERWLDAGTADSARSKPPSGNMVVRDLEELPRLAGTIEMYRAALALVAGDRPGTVMHAKRAIDLSPEEDQLPRAGAAGLMGLAFWGGGDLEAGHRAYAECMAGLRRAGHLADTFGCAIALADIRIAQGRLGDALRTYEQALKLSVGQRASKQGGPVLRGTADMYVGMSRSTANTTTFRPPPGICCEPGTGRARRVAAEPVSLAGRDGQGPRGRGRSGRRPRPAR